MRLDLLLVRLRFARSRGTAQKWIELGHIRRNGARVLKPNQPIGPSDVLTLPMRTQVLVIEILAMPQRRGPPNEARGCYRELDAGKAIAIAGTERAQRETEEEGSSPP